MLKMKAVFIGLGLFTCLYSLLIYSYWIKSTVQKLSSDAYSTSMEMMELNCEGKEMNKMWETLKEKTKKKMREGHSEAIKRKNKELESIGDEKEQVASSLELEINKVKQNQKSLFKHLEEKKEYMRQIDNGIIISSEKEKSIINDNERLNQTLKKELESYREKSVYIKGNEGIDLDSLITMNCYENKYMIQCQVSDTTFKFVNKETTICEQANY